jgi:hypothetical protein
LEINSVAIKNLKNEFEKLENSIEFFTDIEKDIFYQKEDIEFSVCVNLIDFGEFEFSKSQVIEERNERKKKIF